jgi:hypothetical protein
VIGVARTCVLQDGALQTEMAVGDCARRRGVPKRLYRKMGGKRIAIIRKSMILIIGLRYISLLRTVALGLFCDLS